jgi:hypothetical protein
MLYRVTTATPITPKTILQEDGAQVALAEFSQEVRDGEDAIRRIVADAGPGTVWTFRALRETAAEGRRPSVMTVALLNLDESGELQVNYISSTVVANA